MRLSKPVAYSQVGCLSCFPLAAVGGFYLDGVIYVISPFSMNSLECRKHRGINKQSLKEFHWLLHSNFQAFQPFPYGC
jgi:hypothetical protein